MTYFDRQDDLREFLAAFALQAGVASVKGGTTPAAAAATAQPVAIKIVEAQPD